jgi:REP element-mobilizing transposase RayT
MSDEHSIKQFYHQRLPHIQRVGDAFFVTFSLFGSVPKRKIVEYKSWYQQKMEELSRVNSLDIADIVKADLRKNYFKQIDKLLDAAETGPKFMTSRNCARICQEQIHRFDGKLYHLLAYTIMSNHIHLLIDTSVQLENLEINDFVMKSNFKTLDKILKRIKGASAHLCNQELGRRGQFWERESFDTYIRSEKMLNNVLSYILENPVKVGLVKHWSEYEWNYVADLEDQYASSKTSTRKRN